MHYFLNQCISQIILVFLCIKFMLLDLFIALEDVFKIKKGALLQAPINYEIKFEHNVL